MKRHQDPPWSVAATNDVSTGSMPADRRPTGGRAGSRRRASEERAQSRRGFSSRPIGRPRKIVIRRWLRGRWSPRRSPVRLSQRLRKATLTKASSCCQGRSRGARNGPRGGGARCHPGAAERPERRCSALSGRGGRRPAGVSLTSVPAGSEPVSWRQRCPWRQRRRSRPGPQPLRRRVRRLGLALLVRRR